MSHVSHQVLLASALLVPQQKHGLTAFSLLGCVLCSSLGMGSTTPHKAPLKNVLFYYLSLLWLNNAFLYSNNILKTKHMELESFLNRERKIQTLFCSEYNAQPFLVCLQLLYHCHYSRNSAPWLVNKE